MNFSKNTRYYWDYAWVLFGGVVLGYYLFCHRWPLSLAWMGLMIFNAWSKHPLEMTKDKK